MVLCALSEHFKGKFRNPTIGSDLSTSQPLEYDDLDPTAFRQALEFCYRGKVVVPVQELGTLLVLADRLIFTDLRLACVRMLTANLDAESCFLVMDVGQELNCVELIRAAEGYIRNYIHDVVG